MQATGRFLQERGRSCHSEGETLTVHVTPILNSESAQNPCYRKRTMAMNALANAAEKAMDAMPTGIKTHLSNPSQQPEFADPSGEKMKVRRPSNRDVSSVKLSLMRICNLCTGACLGGPDEGAFSSAFSSAE